MSDLSNTKWAFLDHHGLFLPMALRVAEEGATVFYTTPQDRRDRIEDSIIGDGMRERGVVCADSIWTVKQQEKIDCYVFPDVRHSGEQAELRAQGCAVWGAGAGMNLELDRLFFLKKLDELGLDVPPHEIIVGIKALRTFLENKDNIYIKTSKWRGSWETFHWRSEEQDEHNLDIWAVRFGGIRNDYVFICFYEIETDLEIGADTYNVRGRWPRLMLHGIERKDEAYFSAVTEREKMPEQLLPIMEVFAPYLEEVGYVSQWSMETRVAKDANYFIDATTRGGLPSTASFLAAKNAPQVIFAGAHGDFEEIDYGYLFSAECMVKLSTGHQDAWDTVVLAEEVKRELMMSDCCEVRGQTWFPADEGSKIEEIGWLRATGNTPTEVAERMNALADALPDGADANVEALADVIREIDSEHEQGIKFTEQEMPSPEIVLEPS